MKYFQKILAILLVTGLLAGCAPSIPPTSGDPTEVDTTPKFVATTEEERLYIRLFDLANKVEIQIHMSDEELAKMQADYEHYSSFGSKSPIYRKADVTVTIHSANGTERYDIEEVGVRMKGNTSRTDFYSPEEGIYNAIHLKLDFQETFDDEDYYGADTKVWADEESREARKDRTFATLEKLDLRWNRCDDGSYLKEYYAFASYRAFDVLAPHVNLASLDWSGVHMGVYTINEPVDKIFLNKYLPEDAASGDLYKLGWGMGGGASFTNTESIGVEDEDKALFYAFDLKTNKKKSQHEALVALIQNLNDGDVSKEEFAALVDTDCFLRFAAVSYLLGNPDDLRNNYNNCYAYFRSDNGKLLLIPYDYDRCLGVTTHWNPTHTGVTDDDPFSDQLQGVDRNEAPAQRSQRNPLFIYSVDKGGYFVREYAAVLETVADSPWFGLERFGALYEMAEEHYKDLATPDSRLRNAQWLKMEFDLERTSDFSSNDNISYGEYMEAKQKTLAHYLNKVEEYAQMEPQVLPMYYIRADFTDWQQEDAYAMRAEKGCFTIGIEAKKQVRLKVYNSVTGAWFGTECVAKKCTVAYGTDDHTNIVLEKGSYIITFDPATNVVMLEKE
jgi:spore coat protein CotH